MPSGEATPPKELKFEIIIDGFHFILTRAQVNQLRTALNYPLFPEEHEAMEKEAQRNAHLLN